MKNRLLKALLAAGLAFLSAFTGYEIGKTLDLTSQTINF